MVRVVDIDIGIAVHCPIVDLLVADICSEDSMAVFGLGFVDNMYSGGRSMEDEAIAGR